MAEAMSNIKLAERLSGRPLTDEGMVRIVGVQTKVGILVTINSQALGLAEEDGSEWDLPVAVEKDDPSTLLKHVIAVETAGNTQKVALYLAERAGTKVSVDHLAAEFRLTKPSINLILQTIRDRAQTNNWPLLISYSYQSGAGFLTRKDVFTPKTHTGKKRITPLKAKAATAEMADENERQAAKKYAIKQAREGEKEILLLLADNLGEKISFERLIKLVSPDLEFSNHAVRAREYLKIVQLLTNMVGFKKEPKNPFYLEIDDRRSKTCLMRRNPDFSK